MSGTKQIDELRRKAINERNKIHALKRNGRIVWEILYDNENTFKVYHYETLILEANLNTKQVTKFYISSNTDRDTFNHFKYELRLNFPMVSYSDNKGATIRVLKLVKKRKFKERPRGIYLEYRDFELDFYDSKKCINDIKEYQKFNDVIRNKRSLLNRKLNFKEVTKVIELLVAK